jgi:UDP-2-acetamido-3-amino-2,3-dideoxy-glucuronate N-acetyltransferase
MKHIAVIGAGNWGKNLVRVFHKLGNLYAVCDIEELGVPHGSLWVPDYKLLLQNPLVDGVVIATPTKTHYHIAKDALLAGKDVFVEKPMTLSLEESQDLTNIAQDEDRILMVGYLLEYHPGMDRLKELAWRGDLGKINFLHANRLGLGKFNVIDSIVRNLASHDILFALSLIGEEPEKVIMKESSYFANGASDVGTVVLSFKDNVMAYITASRIYPIKERRMVVAGDQKLAVLDDVAKNFFIMDYMGRQTVIGFDSSEPLENECKHFIKCMETREEPKTGGSADVMILTIIERGNNV